MLQTSLDNYFIWVSTAVGLFAIILIWIYLWETARGLKITEILIYKKYVNCPFVFALAMLVILWITTQNLETKILICFCMLTVGWIITSIGALIISAIVNSSVENKREMRRAILPCISKVIIMVVVLWLVY